MIHAYDKTYLDKARTSLGRMLDFAVYSLGYDVSDFFDMFIRSGAAAEFEAGDFRLLAGMSGVELAREVLWRLRIESAHVTPEYTAGRSEEYWAGWALAYYQWATSLRFSEIVACVPIKDVAALYSPYHEMDIRQFVDRMNELYREAKPETNLKLRRQKAGLGQRELAEMAEIPLRTIQQYEQRQKKINKAQAAYLVSLSRALCCSVDDLLEKTE